MRKIYELKFTPKGLFGVKLESDTLFGHICWAIRYLYGNEQLEKLLEKFQLSPVFLISSAFPMGMLPKPVMPPIKIEYNQQKLKSDLKESMKRNKSIKKALYCPLEAYINLQKNLSSSGINSFPVSGNEKKQTGEIAVTRNMINRETFTVEDGALFTETYSYSDQSYVAYIEILDESYSYEWFKELFEHLSKTGLGRDISVGKGRFEIEFGLAADVTQKLFNNNGNFFVSLSHTAGQGLKPLAFQLYPKYGKVGGEFSQSGIFAKNPVIFFKAGSTFIGNEKQSYFGQLIDGVHHDKNIYQYGYAFPLYFDNCEVDYENI